MWAALDAGTRLTVQRRHGLGWCWRGKEVEHRAPHPIPERRTALVAADLELVTYGKRHAGQPTRTRRLPGIGADLKVPRPVWVRVSQPGPVSAASFDRRP